MTASVVVRDFGERAMWTGGQQFVAVLLATGSTSGFIDLPWKVALATAAGAMVVSVATTALQYVTTLQRWVGKRFGFDIGLRLGKTFLASFLGTVGAMQLDVLAFDWSGAFDLAVVATIGAAAKGFLAAGPGPANNPSTLRGTAYADLYSEAT